MEEGRWSSHITKAGSGARWLCGTYAPTPARPGYRLPSVVNRSSPRHARLPVEDAAFHSSVFEAIVASCLSQAGIHTSPLVVSRRLPRSPQNLPISPLVPVSLSPLRSQTIHAVQTEPISSPKEPHAGSASFALKLFFLSTNTFIPPLSSLCLFPLYLTFDASKAPLRLVRHHVLYRWINRPRPQYLSHVQGIQARWSEVIRLPRQW